MATFSVPKAIIDKYETFTPSLFAGGVRPSIYFEAAPEADTSGQISIPYIVLMDDGRLFFPQSDFGGFSEGVFTLDLYDLDLGDIGTSVMALRYNGQNPALAAGLDYAILDLASPLYHILVMPTEEKYSFAGLYREGKRVHQATLTYRVTVGLNANLSA